MIETFAEYERSAAHTAVYPDIGRSRGVLYVTLGLCGEAGEVAEKVKKTLRDHDGRFNYERRLAIGRELGDVLWYVARMCSELGLTMAEVADLNVTKLDERAARGVIGGEGDNR